MPKEFYLSDKNQTLSLFKELVNEQSARTLHQKCLVFGKNTLPELEHVEAYITTEPFKNDPLVQTRDRYIISEKAFKNISGLVSPEPFAAIVKLSEKFFPEKIQKGILILDALSDPGNIGTIFRTALGLGLDGVIILENTVDPYHAKVLRASKAAVLQMPWIRLNQVELADFLKPLDLSLFCADLSGDPLDSIKNIKPFALILGSESQGVSDYLKTISLRLHIPQKHIDSYNVAIASAIISYTLMQEIV